jgi:hypothetical protein
MSNRSAAGLLLDHTHCRAICDEIGERLRDILKREVLEIPPRLLELIDKLAQLEIKEISQLEHAPSLVPSIDEMTVARSREPSNRVKRSAGLARLATNR